VKNNVLNLIMMNKFASIKKNISFSRRMNCGLFSNFYITDKNILDHVLM